jgi:hypothetical protein
MIGKELQDRIVADVSGDLSPTESEQLFHELLKHPEARQLHIRLQRDRDALRNLPRLTADPALPNRILKLLPKQKPIIQLASKPGTARTFPKNHWVGLALGFSAAILVACAAWSLSDRGRPTVAVQSSDEPKPQAVATPKPVEKPAPELPQSNGPEFVLTQPEPAKSPAPKTDPNPVTAKKTKEKSNDVLTSPAIVRPLLSEVPKPRISLPLSAAEFATTAGRNSFRSELSRDTDHRLEFFTSDPIRLADELVRFGKSKSLPIVVETLAGDALRRKTPRTQFALYVENWVANDLATQVRQMAQDKRFETMVLAPLAESDRRELRNLLGQDPLENGSEKRGKTETKSSGAAQPNVSGFLTLNPPPKLPSLPKDQMSFWSRRFERSPGKLRLYLIIRSL